MTDIDRITIILLGGPEEIAPYVESPCCTHQGKLVMPCKGKELLLNFTFGCTRKRGHDGVHIAHGNGCFGVIE